MSLDENLIKSIIIDYFDELRKKIDEQIDELLEIPKNEYVFNRDQIMLLRKKFLRIIHHFRDVFLDMKILLPVEMNQKESIKSFIFKDKFLIYLQSPYNYDNSVFGKLILLQQYIPSNIVEIMENLILSCKKTGKFFINQLDKEKIFAFFLLKQFDPLINHHPAQSNRQDIWLSSDLTKISHIENIKVCHKIDLSKTQISSIQLNCLSSFLNLHTLNLAENELTRFDYELDGLENLTILNLQLNNISHLGIEAFRHLNKLNLLNLHENKIFFIDEYLFKNLSNLTHLDLSNNSIRSIHTNGFESLGNLKELNLRKNEIDCIHKDWFKNLQQLEVLNLSHNFLISSLEPEQFLNLKNLKKLNLSKISLDTISYFCFKGLENLEDLILNECDLDSKLSKEIFQFVPKLRLLCLDKNKIQNLDNLFQLLPDLQVLSLSCNRIETVPENCFNFQRKLKIINLSYNKIKSVSAVWLHKMPNLERIYLNNNQIAELDEYLFASLIKLNTIDLSGNMIRSVNENHFNGIVNSQIIYDEILALENIIKDYKERNIDLKPELSISFDFE